MNTNGIAVTSGVPVAEPGALPRILSSGHGLLEAPIWDDARGLLFTDAQRGGVWQCDTTTGTLQPVIAHRRGIGGLSMHVAGGMIVSGRNVAYKPIGHGKPVADMTAVLFDNSPADGRVGFNDLTTDAAGRIYVGSLSYVPMLGQSGSDQSGALHLIDLDGSVRTVARDVGLSNGLGLSPDGTRLYHADSDAHLVREYPVGANGELGEPRCFAQPKQGMPDGLAVAEDGSVWVALVHAGTVVVYDPAGAEIGRIVLPTPMVTSLCFGGDNLSDLYIVSGAQDAPAALGGCVYRLATSAHGLPRHPARVALPLSADTPAGQH